MVVVGMTTGLLPFSQREAGSPVGYSRNWGAESTKNTGEKFRRLGSRHLGE
jgi:hypothetical protein